jgi:hypothetical protein
LEGFIDEFFDQNPISQVGIIITRNKRAEKISELAGNPRKHIKVFKAHILTKKENDRLAINNDTVDKVCMEA